MEYLAFHTSQGMGIPTYSPMARQGLSLGISISYSNLLQSPVV